MTVQELINELELIKVIHGRDMEVCAMNADTEYYPITSVIWNSKKVFLEC